MLGINRIGLSALLLVTNSHQSSSLSIAATGKNLRSAFGVTPNFNNEIFDDKGSKTAVTTNSREDTILEPENERRLSGPFHSGGGSGSSSSSSGSDSGSSGGSGGSGGESSGGSSSETTTRSSNGSSSGSSGGNSESNGSSSGSSSGSNSGSGGGSSGSNNDNSSGSSSGSSVRSSSGSSNSGSNGDSNSGSSSQSTDKNSRSESTSYKASQSDIASDNLASGFEWKDLQNVQTNRISGSAMVASAAVLMCLLLLMSITVIFSYKIVAPKIKNRDGSGGILWNDNNKAEHLVSASLA